MAQASYHGPPRSGHRPGGGSVTFDYMRVVLTSDLHVEHHREVIALVGASARRLAPDVLVVAGDLTSDLALLEESLRALREQSGAPDAVFVPGNHDLWCPLATRGQPGAPNSRERYDQLIPALARRAGYHALGHQPVAIGAWRFAGVTGWYDYSLRDRELDAQFSLDDYRRGAAGRLRWNDKLFIDWPGDPAGGGQDAPAPALDDEALCAQQVASLRAQLDAIAREGGAPTVVVTHHLPFAELVTSLRSLGLPKAGGAGGPTASPAGLPWDFLNGFMGSARLGEAIRAAPGVRLALSGHTHFKKHAVVAGAHGELIAATSPVGYPREYRRAGLDLMARVDERVTLFEI